MRQFVSHTLGFPLVARRSVLSGNFCLLSSFALGSVMRRLPSSSMWRRVIDILRTRGVSEYFRKKQVSVFSCLFVFSLQGEDHLLTPVRHHVLHSRQRESISRMRHRFDEILDDAVYADRMWRGSGQRHGMWRGSDQSPACIGQMIKTLDNISRNVVIGAQTCC